MKKLSNKLFEKSKRHWMRKKRSNKTIKSVSNLPRVIVNRSNIYIYAQLVDSNWIVIASSNDLKGISWTKKERAYEVWKNLASKILDKWYDKIAFDRNWYIYHWRVEQLAEWIRAWGVVL